MPDKQYRKIGHLLALGTNTKLAKGTQDYLIAGLSLAPSDLSGYRVCTHEKVASCVETCLFYAGRGVMKPVKKARLRKTRLLMEDRHEFLRLLDLDLRSMLKYANKHQKKLAVRLNVLSDLSWENIFDMSKYDIQFYDYTKRTTRLGKLPSNYDLTLSVYEHKHLYPKAILKARETNTNIAAVFDGPIPKTFEGLPTFLGDDDDLRFLDPKPCCVALKAKGRLLNKTILSQMKSKLSFDSKELAHA
jgi:hypothetical protein|tara:strand:+ start:1102 stop:1839 length:738 start_codon:yes stop_codon:yes gene_type:complete